MSPLCIELTFNYLLDFKSMEATSRNKIKNEITVHSFDAVTYLDFLVETLLHLYQN